ncbi:hypothetical protein COCNU_scaffold011181G000010 [Cocos nucifera]|nr:hypothetical protein [Cocos nucifera]
MEIEWEMGNQKDKGSRIFCGSIHMVHVLNRQHQMMVQYDAEGRPVGKTAQEMHSFFGVLRMYDFPDHKRTRDAQLKKIKELYRGYKEEFKEVLAWANHAAMWADWTEEHASHPKNIMRDMMLMLSIYFGGAFMSFEDILACIPALAPLAPSSTLAPPPASAPTPALALAHAPFPDDDDDIDLEDF